jgi:hypothetical protein
MSCQSAVYQWTEVVTKHLPHLSKPQAAVLALWSVGMVLARSCALTAVSLFLAEGLERKPNTVRQQLREWCYEAKAKRGQPRQELAVESCFAPLLGWVLSWWEGQQLALALDATTLGQRFVVLVVSVVYRGCAIPVAWTVLPATEQHAWRGEWLRMLRQVRAVGNRATIDGIDREGRRQNIRGESPAGSFAGKEQLVRCCFRDAGERALAVPIPGTEPSKG